MYCFIHLSVCFRACKEGYVSSKLGLLMRVRALGNSTWTNLSIKVRTAKMFDYSYFYLWLFSIKMSMILESLWDHEKPVLSSAWAERSLWDLAHEQFVHCGFRFRWTLTEGSRVASSRQPALYSRHIQGDIQLDFNMGLGGNNQVYRVDKTISRLTDLFP